MSVTQERPSLSPPLPSASRSSYQSSTACQSFCLSPTFLLRSLVLSEDEQIVFSPVYEVQVGRQTCSLPFRTLSFMTTTCLSGFLSLLHILLNNFFCCCPVSLRGVITTAATPTPPPKWAKEAKPVFSRSAFGTRADSSWHSCVFFCFCRERYSESVCLCRFFSCWICVDLALSEVYHTAILCLFWKRLSGDNVSYYIRNCVRVYVCVCS